MSNITLTSSMRSNLMSLKNIGAQLDKTQQRLSTGLKVNSAIDNASSYYQARSLTNRAADLNNLLDSMSQGIQTIQAAMQGLDAGLSFLEQASIVATEALTEAPHKVLESCVNLVDNSAELIAQGYVGVASVDELKQAIDNGTKNIVLTADITTSESLTFNTEGLNLNGGGHKLTMTSSNYLSFTGDNSSVSNMAIEHTSTWAYRGLSFEGNNASVKDVQINYKSVEKYYARAITTTKSATIENVDITAKGSGTELIGIYASGETTVKNFTMNASVSGTGTIAGIVARNGSDISLDNIGIKASGDGYHYGAVTQGNGKINGISSSGTAERADNTALYDGEGNN